MNGLRQLGNCSKSRFYLSCRGYVGMGRCWTRRCLTNICAILRISTLYSLAIAIRDIEALLLLDKPPLARSGTSSTKKNIGKSKEKEKDPYNRDQYWEYAADKKNAFLKLYGFCFALAKPP
jgi:hypothetical protein